MCKNIKYTKYVLVINTNSSIINILTILLLYSVIILY